MCRNNYEACQVWVEAHLMNASHFIGKPGVHYQGKYVDGEGFPYALYVLNVKEGSCSIGAHYGMDPDRPGDYKSGEVHTNSKGEPTIFGGEPLLVALTRFFLSGGTLQTVIQKQYVYLLWKSEEVNLPHHGGESCIAAYESKAEAEEVRKIYKAKDNECPHCGSKPDYDIQIVPINLRERRK